MSSFYSVYNKRNSLSLDERLAVKGDSRKRHKLVLENFKINFDLSINSADIQLEVVCSIKTTFCFNIKPFLEMQDVKITFKRKFFEGMLFNYKL